MVDWSGWIHVKILLRPRLMVRRPSRFGCFFFFLSFVFPQLSMRTLFLTHNKSKLSPWRVVLVCCLVVAVIASVYSAIDDLIGKSESTVVLLCAVLFGGVVALAYRWFQVRRLQSTVRDLKDSALW